MIENAIWGEGDRVVAVALDDGTVLWVPNDIANRHRAELGEWETEGNAIQIYAPPEPGAPTRDLAADVDALQNALLAKQVVTEKEIEDAAIAAVAVP
jgi:hypothetical protein